MLKKIFNSFNDDEKSMYDQLCDDEDDKNVIYQSYKDLLKHKDLNELKNQIKSIIEEAEKINELVDGVNAAATAADITAMLATLYPVGSIYIGTQSTCPLATLISDSTWELVANGRVLQGSDGTNANTTIAAGLPDITGTFNTISGYESSIASGTATCFQQTTSYNAIRTAGDTLYTRGSVTFNASDSNSIYGNSNTVQPPAYVVNIWRRTA